LSQEIESWDQAPAPAQVGRRLVEGLFQRPLPNRLAPLVNNVTHWGYGVVNGAPYGLVVGSLPRARVWFGVPFGAGVWGSSYVVLPAAGLTGRSGSTTAARSRTTSAPTSSTASPLPRPSGCCPPDGGGRRDLGPDRARCGLTPRGSANATKSPRRRPPPPSAANRVTDQMFVLLGISEGRR
jgi:hypothetical protein